MSEVTPLEGTTKQEPPAEEKAGEILRRERINRRIAIETIARDLKLNVKYMKALEALDYDQLPGEPYLRVYLRSVAKYLSLDPDDILRRFLKERGMDPEEYKASPNKITISMEKVEKPRIPWAIIGVLVGVLVVAGYVGSRLSSSSPKPPAPARAAVPAPKETTPVASPAPVDTSKEDSIIAEKSKPVEATDSTKKTDSLVLLITAVKDSAWMQVYADGKPFRTTLHVGQRHRCTARDSLNVRVGKNECMQYTLNGKPLSNSAVEATKGAEIVAFKVDRSGVAAWPPTKWVSVFKQ
jgi:cytoskeleton protein RodZ